MAVATVEQHAPDVVLQERERRPPCHSVCFRATFRGHAKSCMHADSSLPTGAGEYTEQRRSGGGEKQEIHIRSSSPEASCRQRNFEALTIVPPRGRTSSSCVLYHVRSGSGVDLASLNVKRRAEPEPYSWDGRRRYDRRYPQRCNPRIGI